MKTLILLFASIITISVFGQSLNLTEVCSFPSVLDENSGIQVINVDSFYVHNDGGHANKLYLMNTGGIILNTYIISNTNNTDWEDLAMDNNGNLYIGDFGNNSNVRTDLKIHKIDNPLNASSNNLTAQTIAFNYPDQNSFPPANSALNFDMEAMVFFNDSIYLFSKNRTNPFDGYCKLYQLPSVAGNYVAELKDSLFTGTGLPELNWITAADISPDKSKVILLSHDKLWTLSNFTHNDFFGGSVIQNNLSFFSQKEGITFIDNNNFYVSDEVNSIFGGGKLYQGNLNQYTQIRETEAQTFLIESIVKNSDTIIVNYHLSMPGRIQCNLYDASGNKIASQRKTTSKTKGCFHFKNIKSSFIISQLINKSQKSSCFKKVIFN